MRVSCGQEPRDTGGIEEAVGEGAGGKYYSWCVCWRRGAGEEGGSDERVRVEVAGGEGVVVQRGGEEGSEGWQLGVEGWGVGD